MNRRDDEKTSLDQRSNSASATWVGQKPRVRRHKGEQLRRGKNCRPFGLAGAAFSRRHQRGSAWRRPAAPNGRERELRAGCSPAKPATSFDHFAAERPGHGNNGAKLFKSNPVGSMTGGAKQTHQPGFGPVAVWPPLIWRNRFGSIGTGADGVAGVVGSLVCCWRVAGACCCDMADSWRGGTTHVVRTPPFHQHQPYRVTVNSYSLRK